MPKLPGSPKTGGRQKGVQNKGTVVKQAFAEEGLKNALETGISPLEVILHRMRDTRLITDRQFEAAVAAAPYIHPKQANVTVKQNGDFVINVVTNVPRNPDD